MEKPPLHVMIIGIGIFTVMLIATLHGFGVFDEELVTLISAAIFIILIVSTPLIFYQFSLKPKSTLTTMTSEANKRMIEVGVAFGVLIDTGMKLLARSDRVFFPDHYIKSLLEYSAVFYLQGNLDQLYGPFPIDSQQMNRPGAYSTSSFPTVDYFSYGFKFPAQTTLKSTAPLAILLINYPKKFESRIIDRKEVFSSYLEKLKTRFEDFNQLAGNIETIQNEIQLLSLL